MPSRYEFKAFKYSSHYWILKILEREQKPLKILDVGTASGYLGKVLGERGHWVAGIEGDEESAQKASIHYKEFAVANLETYEFPCTEGFDYIVFADVLEHLRDPAAVLRRSITALKESGKVLVSVPNVANLSVRLSLMFGRFEYTERGILDRTHLRFFTRRTLNRMLSDASCGVLEWAVTPVPMQIAMPFTDKRLFSPLHEVLYLMTRCWKNGMAYQFVVSVAPRRSRS